MALRTAALPIVDSARWVQVNSSAKVKGWTFGPFTPTLCVAGLESPKDLAGTSAVRQTSKHLDGQGDDVHDEK